MPDLTTRTTGWPDPTPPPRPTSRARTGYWLRTSGADRIAAVFALWLTVCVAYWPSCRALGGFWTDITAHTYTHGYLVLLTSLGLVLRSRARLVAAPVRPIPGMAAAVLALSFAWLCFWEAAIQDLHLVLLPMLLMAAILASLGYSVARMVVFPVTFLYFAMPFWSDSNAALQVMSVKVTGTLIWITGIPAYMEGNLIRLPCGTLEIAEGCSGLHFFIVGLALAALYGELSRDRLRQRLFWVVLLGTLALIANWLRIFIIVTAAYLTNMHTFLVAHHYWFGWGLFVIAFSAFLWVSDRMSTGCGREDATSKVADTAPESYRISFGRVFVTIACLAALPAAVYGSQTLRSEPHALIAIDWPKEVRGWQGPDPDVASVWAPEYLHATTEGLRRYLNTRGEVVEVFSAVYRNQTQQAKLLGYYNNLLGPPGRLMSLADRIVTDSSGSWRQSMVTDNSGTLSLVWSRFGIGRRLFAHPRVAQLWYGIAALTSRPVSSVIALRTLCLPSCAAASARLSAAAGSLEPTVQQLTQHPASSG